MNRYVDFYNAVLDMYEVPPWDGYSLNRKQSASLKFYLREYLHLPTIVIAEMLDIRHDNLLRDLRSLNERASEKAVPVCMQPRYRDTIEQLDDLARDMGFAPRPLGNCEPERQMELLWNVAKEIGRSGAYDGEDEMQVDLRALVRELQNLSTEEAVAHLQSNFLIWQA